MPRDERRIIFDYPELYKALFTLCVQKDMRRPPPGAIIGVSVRPDNDQAIVLKIRNEQEGRDSDNEYSRDFVAAALMLYCRTCDIIIPQKGQKSLEINDDRVILYITS